MRAYSKAYPLRDLRSFDGWAELARGADAGLGDDDVVYLRDDLTVVRTPVLPGAGAHGLVETPTAPWRAYCSAALGFGAGEPRRAPDGPAGTPG
ncbi:hypothetical protein ACSNOH_28390 [Streptomyces sp. URMC 127]|uniref:hypothetical protein n=1 Tax=Streptomyces sp. URMC 127 TaxID=3423402 RepID=UPI003F1A290B